MANMKSDHDLHDRRSLEAHRLIAAKLREDPGLLEMVRDNLVKAGEVHPGSDVLIEWGIVLRAPLDMICAFLGSESETATRMRQSTPFTGILSEEERLELCKPKLKS